ncbi:MAG TPA: amino acid permease [Blastocatellia bacterium]|nr:amino acid permease [Blastocatellia bacterium]
MTDRRMTVDEQQAGTLRVTVLRRALGTAGAAAFVVTNMVGTGIFTVPAFVRTATGNGLAALAVWVVGAGLALSGALCYAELATRMPEAGGEYHYLTRIYGKLWGFLSGWISFLVGFSAAIAAAALGASAYAEAVLPGWDRNAPLVTGFGIQITEGSVAAAALIMVLAVFHASGVRPSGRLQTTIAGLVIGAIILFVLAGIGSGRGDWGGVTAGSKSTGLWWVALIQVSFAYSGWNASAYLAGEVINPRRTLPRALIGGTLVVAIIYLALNVLFLYALPANAWEPSIAVGQTVAERLFGAEGARGVSTIITLTIIGSVSSMTAAGPRVYYAMARDGLAHSVFGRLGRRGGAPTVAIFTQAIVAIILALTGAFDALILYAGSALLLLAGLTVAAVWLVPRGAADDSPRFFRTPGYPVTPAIFLILTLVAFVEGLRESPVPTGAALLTILAGIGIYFIARARGWLNDEPVEE